MRLLVLKNRKKRQKHSEYLKLQKNKRFLRQIYWCHWIEFSTINPPSNHNQEPATRIRLQPMGNHLPVSRSVPGRYSCAAWADGLLEPALIVKTTVRCNNLQVRVEVLKISKGLDRHQSAGHGILIRDVILQIPNHDLPSALWQPGQVPKYSYLQIR